MRCNMVVRYSGVQRRAVGTAAAVEAELSPVLVLMVVVVMVVVVLVLVVYSLPCMAVVV